VSKAITWPALIGLLTVLLVVSACEPHVLSDNGNTFLKGFVNQELLALLGVIVAITLTTTGNLHFELNKLQDRTGAPFTKTRQSVRWSAYSLILLFVAGAALVIVKPLLGAGETTTAVCNSIAIVIIVFDAFVLTDLTITTFKLPAPSTLPEKPNDNAA
jgi:uncharacterized membrane protein YidH (DUF202 family)